MNGKYNLLLIFVAALLDFFIYAALLHYDYNKTAFAFGLIQFSAIAAIVYRFRGAYK